MVAPFSTINPPPEQGQIVTLRQRRYLVTDIAKSTLPPQPLVKRLTAQHLVTLTALDDDSVGESLRVIWELEPGALISETVAMPPMIGFDEPSRFDAFLDAVRWGAIASADPRQVQAPFRSGVEIEDYQLDPLIRALQMPRVSLLIADDVGLGKTIEAGLVMQELIVRNRVRTALIVCPAGLQLHWRDQMRDKFGLEFRIVDSEFLRQLRRTRGLHVNPWAHFPRLITSMDFIKRDRPMRLFRETLPAEGESIYPRRYDLLIIDEAHNVAPSGIGQYATDSLRTEAIRVLVPHFEHKLFLSATPHNGYQESFTALLELLDNQRFARGVLPNRVQLETIMVRRLKSELKRWDGKPRFPIRRLEPLEVDYSLAERQAHGWLQEYSALRQQSTQSNEEQVAVEFVLKLLKKRLFSSPAAFAMTLAKHIATLSKETMPEQRITKRLAGGILARQIAQAQEDYADDDAYEEIEGDATETATRYFESLSPREQTLLHELRAWSENAAERPDSKLNALIDWLRNVVKPNGQWSDERVILFTEYRATQNWIQSQLVAAGLATKERLSTLYGGMAPEDRERIKAAFQAGPDQSAVRILLATDAASEGIDLQNYCHRLVHIEIPWNPNRLEQRDGRIDRHGQQFDPQIYHFAPKGYQQLADSTADRDSLDADLEFLMRAAQKVERIREDLGKVGPVIAAQVEEAMLGKRRALNTDHVEHDAGTIRQLLKFERDLEKQIKRQLDQLYETRDALGLTPEAIQNVVRVALEVAGQPPLRPVKLGDGVTAFAVPPLRGSWAAAADGLAHPHNTEMIRPIVFDPEIARGRDDVVLAHLNHRLVQMSLRLLRAEVWSPEGRRGLHRLTIQVIRTGAARQAILLAYARLVLTGGDGLRLHEEVITAGGTISDGRFRRLAAQGDIDAALRGVIDEKALPDVETSARDLYPTALPGLISALEARADDRAASLQRQLMARAEKEQTDMDAILTELEGSIRRELNEPETYQLELFTVDEREQLHRNTSALRARLDRIPAEREAERGLIKKRYSDIQPRLFPVAAAFLIPDEFNR